MADIKNTVEVLDAGISAASEMKEILADGEVSWMEGIKLGIELAPELYTALNGLSQIKVELSDLDKAELQVLAAKGVELAKALGALFGK